MLLFCTVTGLYWMAPTWMKSLESRRRLLWPGEEEEEEDGPQIISPTQYQIENKADTQSDLRTPLKAISGQHWNILNIIKLWEPTHHFHHYPEVSKEITNESQPWLETIFVLMSCLKTAILGIKKGGGSWSMTTLESAWVPDGVSDIQNNISGKSGKLSVNRYCCKTALTASSPQIPMSGTWGFSTTLLRLGLVPMLSGWTLAMSWGLAVGFRSILAIEKVV